MVRPVLLFLLAALAQAQINDISGERMRAHVRFLSGDWMEGRGPGTRGERLTTEYIAAQFALIGARPAGENGTYFQKVPLIGVETEPSATLQASAGDQTVSFDWRRDFVGITELQRPMTDVEAEAVFVGHGIVAQEYNWDDFKGVDVRGKLLVLLTNEPPSEDPKFFEGRALTYYGRWTYKYEQAARMGAAGAIIIHTTPTAGYGWEVVQNSWGREEPQVKLEPGQKALALAGWLSKEAGEKLARLAGRGIDELLKLADSRDFRPIPLGVGLKAHLPAKIRDLDTRNVAAIIPGSEKPSEVVIFSAHWDHLGTGAPVNGDSIYNGAVDNATGVAMLLEMARAWAALPQKPRRSAVFLAVTAEEGGLRGSEYYATHPLFPADKTALDLNFDSFYPAGRPAEVVVTGAERTAVWPIVEEAARRFQLEIKPDARPENGGYFRSDHFSFAKTGIPAFSIKTGSKLAAKLPERIEKLRSEYSKHYHQPSDEYHEEWDFGGLEVMARFGFLVGVNTANLEALPPRLR